VKGEGNEATNTLEGIERKTLYESLGITGKINQSHYEQCLKESIDEHYE
jgi:hypothetical protein